MEKKDKDAAKIPQAGKSIREERYVGYKSLVLDIIGVFPIFHSILFSDFCCTCVLSSSATIRRIPEMEFARIL